MSLVRVSRNQEQGTTVPSSPTTVAAKHVWTTKNGGADEQLPAYSSAGRNAVSYTLETAQSEVHVNVLPRNYDQEALLRSHTEQTDEAFYVVDLGCVRQQVAQWRQLLPRVAPFYGTPHPVA